jgi:hypothetical protein
MHLSCILLKQFEANWPISVRCALRGCTYVLLYINESMLRQATCFILSIVVNETWAKLNDEKHDGLVQANWFKFHGGALGRYKLMV